MRKVLSFILHLSLVNTLFAQESYEYKKGDDVESVLNILEQRIEPVVYCTDGFEKFKVTDCSAAESAIIFNLFDENYKSLLKIEKEVLRYKDYPEVKADAKRQKDLNKISETLNCMKYKMNDTEITCRVSSDFACGDEKRVAYVVNLPQFMKKNLNLCPKFWKDDKESVSERAGVIFHEISHFCGTIDHEYYFKAGTTPNEKKLVKNRTRLTRPNGEPIYPTHAKPLPYYHDDIACTNADSYRYWLVNGFCLPGYDCAKR